jgi:hypothetical protein
MLVLKNDDDDGSTILLARGMTTEELNEGGGCTSCTGERDEI